MGPEKLKEIERIYLYALETTKDKRIEYLDKACGENVELRREVESLLGFDQTSDELINQTPEELAAEMLSEIKQTDFSGKRIGQYEVLSQIGKGGMGTVYLAKDRTLERRVAIKFLDKEFSQNEDRLKRFILEARTASALNHPNIITIYEVGEFEETNYIATEFIEGKTLRKQLKADPINNFDSVKIAIQIASALDAAHNAGIVHRDIKPDNIMIRPDGLAKILDFGIAKLSVSNDEKGDKTIEQTLTKTGMIIGTAKYMSPEQARGKKVDARTDIFSFGVVLYLMLTGKLPFEGETTSDIIASILKEEPNSINEFNEDISVELEQIVQKSLKKEKHERYQTSKEMLDELKQCRKHLELSEERLNSAERSNISGSKTDITNFTTDNSLKPNTTDDLHEAQTIQATGNFQKSRSLNAYRGFGVGILLLSLIGFGYWYFFTKTSNQIDSIAVLPLVNDQGNEDSAYLTDGITESLINNLSQIPELSVKSRHSVFRYKGKEMSPRKIGEELKVQAVLIGRVIQNGENLTLNVELVDTEKETVLWGDKFTSNTKNLLVLQMDITQNVSNKLRPGLNDAEKAKISKEYTTNTEAYEAYLKGRFHWNKREGDNLKLGIKYFEKAIEIDPNFALAWSGLADSYSAAPSYSDDISHSDAKFKSKSAAIKAIELDSELAEAYASLGQVLNSFEWKFAEAEKNYAKAIALNPNYVTAYNWQAELYGLMGKYDKAIDAAKKAVDIEPFSLRANFRLGEQLMDAKRFDEAATQLDKAEELDPDSLMVKVVKAELNIRTDEAEKAIEIMNEVIAKDGRGHFDLRRLATAYVAAGKKPEARKLLEELLEMYRKGKPINWDLAIVYASLGEDDKALDYLNKSFQKREDNFPFFKTDLNFEKLQNNQRYKELLEKVNLAD